MSVLWTSHDAAEATGGMLTGPVWEAHSVSIDTRTIEPGALFVALKDVRDGHDFVADALSKGAVAALVSRVPHDVPPDAPLLLVDDVLNGLEDMAQHARARTQARVIAVTGSVGKTSTKEMLRAALAGQGEVHAAERSFNNHWGVPLTLARMPVTTSFAVIEIGMNHPGEIAPLARLTRPHVAVVTTVAAAHLEAFGNVDGIAREKASIMDGLEPGGIAVLNADLPTSPILLAALPDGAKSRLFGSTSDADWRAVSIEIAEDATVVELDAAGEKLIFKLATPGRHFALNGVASLAAADAAGADLARASIALSQWTAFEGRGTRETIVFDTGTRNGVFTLIDDAYNANPTSLTASLEVLAASNPRDADGAVTRGRRVAILGDMLELGTDAVHIHALVARQPTLKDVDIVHCAGPLMRNLWTALPAHRRGEWCETAQELAGKVRKLVGPGDVVLVKGSLGSRVSLCVDALRKLGQST